MNYNIKNMKLIKHPYNLKTYENKLIQCNNKMINNTKQHTM